MNTNYNNAIIYVKTISGATIYYVVKDYDGNTIRIEQLQKYQPQLNDRLYSLDELRQNKKLNIIYYSCGYYDKEKAE